MKNKKQIIIFSHGFGVKKDDLGLLTDIASVFPEFISVLFDYYDVDEKAKTITTRTFTEQKNILARKIKEVKEKYLNSDINIIAHSQGTLIPALAELKDIKKTILLAPVFDMGLERTFKRYEGRAEVDINLNGISTLPKLDGYIRFVPKEYWEERIAIKPFDLFNNYYKNNKELVIINANQDNILTRPKDLSKLNEGIKVLNIDGGHSFEGKDRKGLLEKIKEII